MKIFGKDYEIYLDTASVLCLFYNRAKKYVRVTFIHNLTDNEEILEHNDVTGIEY